MFVYPCIYKVFIICVVTALSKNGRLEYNNGNIATTGLVIAQQRKSSPIACADMCLRHESDLCDALRYNDVNGMCEVMCRLTFGGITWPTGDFNQRTYLKSPKNMAVMDITSCGLFWYTHGSYCYKAVSTLQTWIESRDNCRLLDAELASVTDVCEHAFLVGFLTSLEWETKYVWLGGSDANEQNTWTWLSREPFVFSAFGIGQPDDTSDQDCLAMEARFGWRDLPCSESRRSLCKKRAK